MFKNKDTVPEVLNFIIQYANDIDVGKLIKYSKFIINDREPLQEISSNNIMSNKELLLLKLCLASRDYYTHRVFTKFQNNFVGSDVIEHLKSIAKCYNSYLAKSSPVKNLVISEDTLGLDSNIQTESIETYKYQNNLQREIIKEILSFIINCYAQYNFYYMLTNNGIEKFGIDKNKLKPTKYTFKYAKRTSYIINENNGFKLNLGVPVQFFGFNSDADVKNQHKQLRYFKKLNNAIIMALAREPETCYWCFPNRKRTPTKEICANCCEILNTLEILQLQKENQESIINIEKELKKFNYKKYANVMTLRKRRKDFLKYVVLDCKENINIPDKIIVSLIELINKGFGRV